MSEALTIAQDFAYDILWDIVTQPDQIVVTVSRTPSGQVLEVEIDAAEVDKGIIIGSEGRNIAAIQTLLNCLGSKLKVKLHARVKTGG